MLIVGAGGHSKEVLDILIHKKYNSEIVFFDNINSDKKKNAFGKKLISTYDEAYKFLKKFPKFVVAIGSPVIRCQMFNSIVKLGGIYSNIVSEFSYMSSNATLECGVMLMPFSSINYGVEIGRGALINSHSSVHHDCKIGEFFELSPGARVLGNVRIGNFCSVGSNAVILPNVRICDNVLIGAGAVVTKDILDEGIYAGIPARKIR